MTRAATLGFHDRSHRSGAHPASEWTAALPAQTRPLSNLHLQLHQQVAVGAGGNAIVAGTIRGLGKPGVAIGGPSEIRPVTLWARLECRFGLCLGRAKVSGQMPAVQIALPSACDAR